jgi:hypothetical protein
VNAHIWQILHIRSSILPKSRQTLVDAAIESNATHLLFLDADMTFPPNLARRLLAHKVDVVGCNCVTKQFPSLPTARNEDLSPVPFEQEKPLIPVWRVGTGVLMVTTDVLRKLPRPCFTPRWDEGTNDYVGEDWAFIEHVENAGYTVHLDTELSKEIGHVGKYTFTPEDVA